MANGSSADTTLTVVIVRNLRQIEILGHFLAAGPATFHLEWSDERAAGCQPLHIDMTSDDAVSFAHCLIRLSVTDCDPLRPSILHLPPWLECSLQLLGQE